MTLRSASTGLGSSRLRENYFGTAKQRWLTRLGQEENAPAGCSRMPSSKAAASEEARRTLRYVEPLSEVRTPLADFFSILLGRSCRGRAADVVCEDFPMSELASPAICHPPASRLQSCTHSLTHSLTSSSLSATVTSDSDPPRGKWGLAPAPSLLGTCPHFLHVLESGYDLSVCEEKIVGSEDCGVWHEY